MKEKIRIKRDELRKEGSILKLMMKVMKVMKKNTV